MREHTRIIPHEQKCYTNTPDNHLLMSVRIIDIFDMLDKIKFHYRTKKKHEKIYEVH